MLKQRPLQFEFQTNQRFNTFYAANNAETVSHLKQLCINQQQFIYLWGAPGAGKTHLMQASSQAASSRGQACFCFSLQQQLPPPTLLDGLEKLDLVCFDNIENIAGNGAWERAFFNFFNLHRDHNKRLLLTASHPPKSLPIQLADLKTRMNWGLTLKLNTLTDEQQLHALIFKANNLGFKIPLNVGQFLMARYARDLPSVWHLLDKVAQATLAEKRTLTIPFLKKIMGDV